MLTKEKLWRGLFIPVAAFVFIGCTNEDMKNDEMDILKSSGHELYVAYNDDNPFEIHGIRHNQYLNSWGNVLKQEFGESWGRLPDNPQTSHAEDACVLLCSHVYHDELTNNINAYHQNEQVILNNYVQNPSLLLSDIDDLSSDTDILANNFEHMQFYDEVVAPYYEEIKNILISRIKHPYGTIDSMIEDLTEVENKVLAEEVYHTDYFDMLSKNEEMTNIDRLLVYISVLKHSIIFWNDAFFNEGNSWHSAMDTFLDLTYGDSMMKGKFLDGIKNLGKRISKFFRHDTGRVIRATISVVCIGVMDAAAGSVSFGIGAAVSGLGVYPGYAFTK